MGEHMATITPEKYLQEHYPHHAHTKVPFSEIQNSVFLMGNPLSNTEIIHTLQTRGPARVVYYAVTECPT